MCDPLTLIAGAVGGSLLGKPKGGQAPAAAQQDPAEERQKVEAEAAQRANMQLAMDKRRAREQQSLLARGGQAVAPTFTMGDQTGASGPSPLSSNGKLMSRSTVARVSSLISRGAPVGVGGGFSGGRGGMEAMTL